MLSLDSKQAKIASVLKRICWGRKVRDVRDYCLVKSKDHPTVPSVEITYMTKNSHCNICSGYNKDKRVYFHHVQGLTARLQIKT